MISEAFSFYDESLIKSVKNGQTATEITPSGTKPFTPESHQRLRNKSHKSKEDKKQIRGQVFHEFKHGGLKSGSGAPVTDRKQAIAIALSESGESNKSLDTEVISFYTEDLQKFWSDAARQAAAEARHGSRDAAEATLSAHGWTKTPESSSGTSHWEHASLPGHSVITTDEGWSHASGHPSLPDSAGVYINDHQTLKDKLTNVESGLHKTLRKMWSDAARAAAIAARAHPSTMAAAAINKELDQNDQHHSEMTDQLIAAGRGNECHSEIITKPDTLSQNWKALTERSRALRDEIANRYGPGAPSRLPPGRGFGPIKSLAQWSKH